MKSKTSGAQAFNVPNTEEGREFCRLLKKFLNRKGWYYRRRGRGSRQEHGTKDCLPLEHCEWMAIYLSDEKRKPRIDYKPEKWGVEAREALGSFDTVFDRICHGYLDSAEVREPDLGPDEAILDPMELRALDIAVDLADEPDLLAEHLQVDRVEAIAIMESIRKKLFG